LPDPDEVFKGIERLPPSTVSDKGQKTATVTKPSDERAKDANTEEQDAQLVDHQRPGTSGMQNKQVLADPKVANVLIVFDPTRTHR